MRYLFIVVMSIVLFAGCQPKVVAPRKEEAPPLVAAEVKLARESGWPVAVADLSGFRDASNEIAMQFTLANVSDRTITRLYLTAYLRNGHGDPVLDERTRSIYRELEFAGPIRPDEVRWGNRARIPMAFRHAGAARLHVRDLRVVYADGTETPPVRVEGQAQFTGPIRDVVP